MPEVSRAVPLRWFSRAMNFAGRFEFTTLFLLAVAAGGLWLFVAVAGTVVDEDAHALDRALLLALRNPDDLADPIGPHWAEELMRDITALGGVGFLLFLTLAVAGYVALLGKPRIMMFVVASVLGGMVLSYALKMGFDRPRPDLVAHGSHVYTRSFPSGHSMMAAVTYLTLASLLARVQRNRRLKAYLLLVAIFLTLAVGVSRVYLGVHWPSDVLAGWTMGAVWAAICGLTARWLQRRGQVEQGGTSIAADGQTAGPL